MDLRKEREELIAAKQSLDATASGVKAATLPELAGTHYEVQPSGQLQVNGHAHPITDFQVRLRCKVRMLMLKQLDEGYRLACANCHAEFDDEADWEAVARHFSAATSGEVLTRVKELVGFAFSR